MESRRNYATTTMRAKGPQKKIMAYFMSPHVCAQTHLQNLKKDLALRPLEQMSLARPFSQSKIFCVRLFLE